MTLSLDLRRRARRAPDVLRGDVSLLRWTVEPSGEDVLLVSAAERHAPEGPAVLLSLANTSASQPVTLTVTVPGRTPPSVTGTLLSMPAATPPGSARRAGTHVPKAALVRDFTGSVVRGRVVEVTVPATSVVVLTLQ